VKTLCSLMLIFISAQAQSYQCPAYLQDNPEASVAHEWAQRFQGAFQLGGCHIEITACEQSHEPGLGSPVGEVFIETKNGRQAYVSLRFPASINKLQSADFKAFSRAIWYQKTDLNYEDQDGRTEVWRLEIQNKIGHASLLDLIELGVYSTNKALGQKSGNDSRWYVCKRQNEL